MTSSVRASEPTDGVFPTGVVETPRHLVLPVLDFSGSMGEQAADNFTKAEAVTGALRDLLTRFKVSRVLQNFSGAVVSFDTTAPAPMAGVDDNADYNFIRQHGGGTHVFPALEEAERLVAGHLARAPSGGVPHSAVILLMSDGCCSQPQQARAVAQRIKTTFGSRVVLACALLATVGQVDAAGEQLLREIATDPVTYFKTVYDANTLRDFFERSASSASGDVKIG